MRALSSLKVIFIISGIFLLLIQPLFSVSTIELFLTLWPLPIYEAEVASIDYLWHLFFLLGYVLHVTDKHQQIYPVYSGLVKSVTHRHDGFGGLGSQTDGERALSVCYLFRPEKKKKLIGTVNKLQKIA